MKRLFFFSNLVLFLISCHKNDSTTSYPNEEVQNTKIIGANISSVITLNKSSEELYLLINQMKAKTSINEINSDKIEKISVKNSKVTAYCWVLKQEKDNYQYIIAYSYKGNYIFTKAEIRNLPNGNKVFTMNNFKKIKYFSCEIKPDNHVGNFHFENEIPFKSLLLNKDVKMKSNEYDSNNIEGYSCHTLPYLECMNCLTNECLSSVWCIILCGAQLYRCLVGFSINCVIP